MMPRPVLLASLLAFSLPAFAGPPSFSLEQQTPDPANVYSAFISSGDGLARGQLATGLSLQYERDPLVYFENGQEVGKLVHARMTVHLGAAFGVTDWLELGASLPLVAHQGGDDLTSHGYAALPSSGVGSPLLQGRFTLLREQDGKPLDLGITLGLNFPVGSESSLSREPSSGVAFTPRVGAGRVATPWLRIGGEVGAVIRGQSPTTTYSTDDHQVGSYLTFAATASTLGEGLRGELDVRSLVALTDVGNALEVLAGARYPIAHHTVEAYVLAGPSFGGMPGAPSFRVVGGFSFPLATSLSRTSTQK